MKTTFKVILAAICFSSPLMADNLVVSGVVQAGGTIYSTGSYIQAQTFFYTPGYISLGNYVYANNYVFGATYVQSPSGIFTNVLRTGGSTATASLSVGLGAAATATSYSSVVVGRYNVTTASDGGVATAGSWVGKDPLFVVGNGSGTAGDPNQLRNALTVYKDGSIKISKRQGDIKMGIYGTAGSGD